MKIVLAQQNYIIGDFDYNTTKIIAAIQKAESLQADLIVFSELAICGYPPRDFLGYPDFVEAAQHALKRLLPYTSKVAVLVGCPSSNPNPKGKNLFNSAYLLHKKQIVDVIHKSCLPNYDVFDEYRYFEGSVLKIMPIIVMAEINGC